MKSITPRCSSFLFALQIHGICNISHASAYIATAFCGYIALAKQAYRYFLEPFIKIISFPYFVA